MALHAPGRRAATVRLRASLSLLILIGCLSACSVEPVVPADQGASASAAKTAPPEVALRNPADVIQSRNSFQIVHVTLFDGEKLLDWATVVVKDGWIVDVCSETEAPCATTNWPTIEGAGKFLMPAMIDAEGHFSRPAEMLGDLLSHEAPRCGTKAENKGRVLQVSSSELLAAFSEKDLFTEVDTHGLRLDNGLNPHKLGGRYPIPPSANYEKQIRFGVTTVLDMAAYPWPANYVKRSRNQWEGRLEDAEAADLKKEFLIYADLYGSGMWAAPATLQFAFFGMDPVYNVQPDGPWDRSRIEEWVARRRAEGSDHIKVFYEKWQGGAAPSISAATLNALVQAAHAQGLKVFIHNESEAASQDVIASGVDVNIHAPGLYDTHNGVISDEFADRFVHAVKVIAPTMAGMLQGCENPYALGNVLTHALSAEIPGSSFTRAYLETRDVLPYLNALDEMRIAHCGGPDDFQRVFHNTAKLYDHGAMLLVGTDAADFSPLIEGLGVHYEAYLIREALDQFSTKAKGAAANLAALKAATSNAALAYGLHIENGNRPQDDPRGFIKPGYRADLLLLRESPIADMLNTLKIDRVFKAGYVANRQMVRPECASGTCETRRILHELQAKACP